MRDILNILVLRLDCLHRDKNNNKKQKNKNHPEDNLFYNS